MRQEKALRTAIKIVGECRKHSEEGSCRKCPFNIGGCIIATGDGDIPAEWSVTALMDHWEVYMNKKG